MAQALTTQYWATSLCHSLWFAVGLNRSTAHDALDRCAKSLSKGRDTCRHAGPFAVNACKRRYDSRAMLLNIAMSWSA